MNLTLEEKLRKFGDDFVRRVGKDGVVPHAALCLSCGIAIEGCSHDWDPERVGLPGDLVADIRDIATAAEKDLVETTRLLLVSAVYLIARRGGRYAAIDLLDLRHKIERAGILDESAQIVAFPDVGASARTGNHSRVRGEIPHPSETKKTADGGHD